VHAANIELIPEGFARDERRGKVYADYHRRGTSLPRKNHSMPKKFPPATLMVDASRCTNSTIPSD